MPGAFGLADDVCHDRVSPDRLVESHVMADVHMLHREGLLVAGTEARLEAADVDGGTTSPPRKLQKFCWRGSKFASAGIRHCRCAASSARVASATATNCTASAASGPVGNAICSPIRAGTAAERFLG